MTNFNCSQHILKDGHQRTTTSSSSMIVVFNLRSRLTCALAWVLFFPFMSLAKKIVVNFHKTFFRSVKTKNTFLQDCIIYSLTHHLELVLIVSLISSNWTPRENKETTHFCLYPCLICVFKLYIRLKMLWFMFAVLELILLERYHTGAAQYTCC